MESYDYLKLTISKSNLNYEDLYIYIMTKNGSRYMYLRELTSCDSDIIVMEFEEIKYLSIRSDKLYTDSNYSILVERQAIPQNVLSSILISVILGIVMLVFAIVTFILLYLSCKQWVKERRLRIEQEAERRNRVNHKDQWIDDTISSMACGNIANLVQKFKQEN